MPSSLLSSPELNTERPELRVNSWCQRALIPQHTHKHTLPPLQTDPNLSPTSQLLQHTLLCPCLFSLLLVASIHLSIPIAARHQVPTPRPIPRSLSPTGASHSSLWKVNLLGATSSSTRVPPHPRRPLPTPTLLGAWEGAPDVPAERAAATASSRRTWQSARVMATQRPRWRCEAPEPS